MNNIQHQAAVKKAVKGRFYGHSSIKSKVTPLYPDTAEREFKRVTNGYMRLINKAMKDRIPSIMQAYKQMERKDSRYDSNRELEESLRKIFLEIAQDIEQKLHGYGLDGLVRRISQLTKNSSLREWKRVVHETLGIDLMDDYYSAEFYEAALRRWVDENVLKIKSIPTQYLGDMQQIVLDAYRNGDTITNLAKVKRLEGHGDVCLFVANEKENRKADLIYYQGSWYECVSSQLWDHTVLSHYNYQFVEVPLDASNVIDLSPPVGQPPKGGNDL